MARGQLFSEASDAAFDSHSGLALMNNDSHFVAFSERWRRVNLTSSLKRQDLEFLHESMHWIQHVSTGSGLFLNRLRRLRDECIVQNLRLDHSASIARVQERLLRGKGDSEIDYTGTLNQIQQRYAIESATDLAVLLRYIETTFFSKSTPDERASSVRTISLGIYYLLKHDSELRETTSAKAFVERYLAQGIDYEFPSTDRGYISTEHLYESHAFFVEQIFMNQFNHGPDATERLLQLYDSEYNEPFVYFTRILFSNLSNQQYLSMSKRIGVLNVYLTFMICIDISLDIFFPDSVEYSDFSEIDWFPPYRFAALVNAVFSVGFIDANNLSDRDRQFFFQYYLKLKNAAGLRTSTDVSFPFPVDEWDRSIRALFSTGSRKNLPQHEINPPGLYSLFSCIQRIYWLQKKHNCSCFLIDPVLNLSNNFAPDFVNFFDGSDPIIAHLSNPILLLYRNGSLGIKEHSPAFSRIFACASIATYPRYAIAFENGPIALAPISYGALLNFNGITPPELFMRSLRRDVIYKKSNKLDNLFVTKV